MKQHNPEGVAAPVSAYTHGIEVPPNARWLTVSGQVGIGPDGSLAADAGSQSEVIWQNISRILESAGMEIGDIVKMTAYLVDPADLAAYGAVRTKYLGDHRPASTLVYVSALVKEDMKVEVEVQAARSN
ncbi:MAG: RidA family protein [Proteobacteria bacterium]|nr:MAG: RidA family protein [Pseudomonadota bacterium]